MSTNTESESRIDRRTFMKGVGVTGAAAVGMGSPSGPVGQAEALPPLVIAGGYAAGTAASGVSVGWTLRELEILGADSPPEGLTPEALDLAIGEKVRVRHSDNESTFLDNLNIVEGLSNSLYIDGKVAAIEKLNEQESQSEVQATAIDAIESYGSTIVLNLLRSWNETCRELQSMLDRISAHPDLSEDFLKLVADDTTVTTSTNYTVWPEVYDDEMTLPDGSTHVQKRIKSESNSESYSYHLTSSPTWSGNEDAAIVYDGSQLDDYLYLHYQPWNEIYEKILDEISDVKDGIIVWIDGVYGDVQSGDIDVAELLTPREQAELLSDDEDYPQAVADLIALNIPVDPDREATISFTERDITISGLMAPTSPPADGFVSGETYDPSAEEWDLYFTYDPSLGSGGWSEYEAGVDGGTATFTAEPFEEVIYRIETAADETASVTADDFTEEDDGTYTVDLSDQLENAITEIVAVGIYSEDGETSYETVQIREEFTLDRLEDSDGNEVQESEFSTSEPQTDENYITQEEWDELAEQNQELIDKYEEASNDDGLFGGGGFGDWGDIPVPGGATAAAVGVGVVVLLLGALRQIASFYLPGR